MNIDELTIKELRGLMALLQKSSEVEAGEAGQDMIGKYVICRGTGAGVHAGRLIAVSGDAVKLSNSRRLWSWTAVGGVALSGLAVHGLKHGKVDTTLPEIWIRGVVEIIPCSAISEESIANA